MVGSDWSNRERKLLLELLMGSDLKKYLEEKNSYYFYELLFKPLKTKILISFITAPVKYSFNYIILIYIKKKNIHNIFD